MFGWYEPQSGARLNLKLRTPKNAMLEPQARRYSSVLKVHKRRRSIQNETKVHDDPLVYSMIRHEKTLNSHVIVSLPQLDRRKTLKNLEMEVLTTIQKETPVDFKQVKHLPKDKNRIILAQRPEHKREESKPKWFEQSEESPVLKKRLPSAAKVKRKPLKITEATNQTLQGWSQSSGVRWHMQD